MSWDTSTAASTLYLLPNNPSGSPFLYVDTPLTAYLAANNISETTDYHTIFVSKRGGQKGGIFINKILLSQSSLLGA